MPIDMSPIAKARRRIAAGVASGIDTGRYILQLLHDLNISDSDYYKCRTSLERPEARPPCKGSWIGDRLTVSLHLGFLSVEETQEQLDRLRWDPAEFEPEVASSKISRTNNYIRPINWTSKLVAPTEENPT